MVLTTLRGLVQLEGLMRATAVPTDSSCAAAYAWRTEPQRQTPSTLRALNPGAAMNGRAAALFVLPDGSRDRALVSCPSSVSRARLRLDELPLHVSDEPITEGWFRKRVPVHWFVTQRADARDREPEGEEERVDAREAHAHGPAHDVARRER